MAVEEGAGPNTAKDPNKNITYHYKIKSGVKTLKRFTGPSSSQVMKTPITVTTAMTNNVYITDHKGTNGYLLFTGLGGYAGWFESANFQLVKEVNSANNKVNWTEQLQQMAISIDDAFVSTLNAALPGLDGSTSKWLMNRVSQGNGTLDVSTRLFGQPFQFNAGADFRISEKGMDQLGRKYVETFISEAPIVHIIPGMTSFLPGVDQEKRDTITDFFKGAGKGLTAASTKILEEMLDEESRYFEFVSTYTMYMRYVNLMCRAAAIYMGIGDKKVLIDKNIVMNQYQYFDWKHYKYSGMRISSEEDVSTNTIFDTLKDFSEQLELENIVKGTVESILGIRNGVQLYVDPGTSFQETLSNSTTTSSLSGIFEKAQGFSKEFHFYSGMADNDGGGNGILNSAISTANGVADTVMDLFSGGTLSKLFGAGKTIINGGNVILPDIWADSAYQKSYSINLNLISPYGTKESIYLHVLVPLFHIMALAAPRQITSNGFASPFIVKVSSKGWFSCEMGMIDSVSIEKVQGSWTVNGIPTEIKVSISVRDLYSELMVTSSATPGLFIANRGLTNWLAVTSGVDIVNPALQEKWETIMKMLLLGTVESVGDSFSSVKEQLQNVLAPWMFF